MNIVDPEREKQVNRAITAIILITSVPSVYLGYQLVQNENFSQNAEHFVNQVSVVEGNYLQKDNISASGKSVELIYSGYGLLQRHIDSIKLLAVQNRIDTARLSIKQGFEASFVQENTRKFQSEAEILNDRLKATAFALQQSERRADSIKNISVLGETLLAEIRTLYPQIKGCSYTESFSYFTRNDSVIRGEQAPLILFTVSPNSLRPADKNKIHEWLKSRLYKRNATAFFNESF